MLQKIRDNASGWLARTILWTLIAAFVGTIFLVRGVGDESDERPAAYVGDYVISTGEYQRHYNNLVNRLRQADGGELDPDLIRLLKLERVALEDLISEKLEYMAAKEMGFKVTDEELGIWISRDPNFQTDGRFDKSLYFNLLRSNGLSTQDYESILRVDLVRNKMVRLITDSVFVAEKEIKDEYLKINEEVNAKYIMFSPALFEAGVDLSEKAVSDYFSENKFLFSLPEERKIEYLYAGQKAFMEKVEISGDEKRSYYDSNQSDYVTEEKLRARHILLAVPEGGADGKLESEMEKKAEELLNEIKGGADFIEMAKKHSDGPTKDKGGDLGFFGRGSMVPQFEEAVFAMEPGEVKGPVRTRFGFHIIKLEEKKPASIAEYEKVADKIENILKTEKSRKIAKASVASIARNRQKVEGGWKGIADSSELVFSETKAASGKPVFGIAGSVELSKRIFSMKKGDRAGPIEMKNGYYLIRLLEIIPPRQPELSEVQMKVKAKMRMVKSRQMARETAEKFLTSLRGGKGLESVAREMGLEAKETGFIRRGSAVAGISGTSFAKAVFGVKMGEYRLHPIGDKNYILQVLQRKAPDAENFEKERGSILRALKARKDLEVLSMWRRQMREDGGKNGVVKIEPGFEL